MRFKFLKQWTQGFVDGLSRFPLGWAISVAVAIASILLSRATDLGFSDVDIQRLARVLFLWPFGIFGNVALRLRAERNSRSPSWELLVFTALLIVSYFFFPDKPLNAFWIGYGAAILSVIIATVVLPIRCTGEPEVWDSAWPIVQATLMATLSAIVVVSGVNAALFSIEKLFSLKSFNETYLNVFTTGFFLIAPVTAFAWMPNPFGSEQAQPRWVKGAMRIVIIPLTLVYGLILYAYIGKIIIAMRWPDGWVAMPTLIFAAIGILVYLTARTAHDRSKEKWASVYCRVFPFVLLPTAIVLLLAMHTRISTYGFTPWRVIGLLLGIWILGFAALFAIRPKTSNWLLVASLGVFTLFAVVAPGYISKYSQSNRLEQRLESLGYWEVEKGEQFALSDKDWKEVESMLTYLCTYHGIKSFPEKVFNRLDEKTIENVSLCQSRFYYSGRTIMNDLGFVNETHPNVLNKTITCNEVPLDLANWRSVRMQSQFYNQNKDYLWVDNNLQVMSPQSEPVGKEEREAFLNNLLAKAKESSDSPIRLPAEFLGYNFFYMGKNYRVQFFQVDSYGRKIDGESPFYSSHSVLLLEGSATDEQ